MIKIIPAIDIIDGKCVRLTKGDYSTKKIYNQNPLEVAKEFEDNGIKLLHLVDLDGAKKGEVQNHKVLHKIASKTSLKVDFGGGIKSDSDIKICFENGANQVNIGSTAVSDKPLFLKWLSHYGADKIILSSDVKDNKISISGWLKDTDTDIHDFLDFYQNKGIKNVVCTDISKDGMLQGTSIELYKDILQKQPDLNLVASGGLTSVEEIDLLQNSGLYGVIIGKAIYENKISLKQLEKYAQ